MPIRIELGSRSISGGALAVVLSIYLLLFTATADYWQLELYMIELN